MLNPAVRLSDPILLASASPRRVEALRALGFPVVVSPADVDESVYDGMPIRERVVALAELKARRCLAGIHDDEAPSWVVGADTLVSIDGKALGKPAGEREARAMLRSLSGRTHVVSSGVCVLDRRRSAVEKAVSETSVTFSALSASAIDWYIGTGEWEGVAGAYRIQERAALFVERIEGSFSGVVGLPLHAFYAILERIGYPFPFGKGSDASS